MDSSLWNDGRYLLLQFMDRDSKKRNYMMINLFRNKKIMGFHECYQDINIDYSKVVVVRASKTPSIDVDFVKDEEGDDDELDERPDLDSE